MKLQHLEAQMAGLRTYGDAAAWQLYKEVVNFHGACCAVTCHHHIPPSRTGLECA